MAEKFISLEAAQKQIDKELYMTESEKAAMKNIVRKTPVVDVVEVVRCKDCAFSTSEVVNNEVMLFYCNRSVGLPEIDENDFCSYGERKDNN